MTGAQDLLRLADELEKATGQDRRLDALIQRAMGPDFPVMYSGVGVCNAFTASLDTAETLVPQGDDVTGERYRLEAYSTNGILMPAHIRASAWVPGAPRAFAATPAMALCCAALRARAHSTKESDNG